MHEVEVDVVEAEFIERLLEGLGNALMVLVWEFCGKEDLLARDARLEHSLAHGLFIEIARSLRHLRCSTRM